jgi:hypothetical protein
VAVWDIPSQLLLGLHALDLDSGLLLLLGFHEFTSLYAGIPTLVRGRDRADGGGGSSSLTTPDDDAARFEGIGLPDLPKAMPRVPTSGGLQMISGSFIIRRVAETPK